MRQKLAPLFVAALAALFVASMAVAQSPGLGIKKDTTLTGTGSSGSPLGVNTTNIQRRVTGTCSTPNAIGTVNADGSVTCVSGSSVTATGDFDLIAKFDGTSSLVSSNFFDDGTYTGLRIDEFDFLQNLNGAGLGKINNNGFFGTTAHFRDLGIYDGKRSAIATFTGSTKATALLGALTVAGSTTVGDLRGTVQNYTTPTGVQTITLNATTTILRVNATSDVQIVGLTGGSDGRIVIIENKGSANDFLYDESAIATAANRFALGIGGGFGYIVNGGNMSALCRYDGTSARWRCQWLVSNYSPSNWAVLGDITATGNAVVAYRVTGGSLRIAALAVTIASTPLNDWNPDGVGSFDNYGEGIIEITSAAANTTVTGIDSALAANGDHLTIVNRSTKNVEFAHSSGSSLAANRMSMLGAINQPITPGGSIDFMYKTGTGWIEKGKASQAGTYDIGTVGSTALSVNNGSMLTLGNSGGTAYANLWWPTAATFDIDSGASETRVIGSGGFHVTGGQLSADGNSVIGDANADTATLWGHLAFSGSAPAMSACGTTPTVNGNDNRGIITLGSGTATSCTLTFSRAWAGTPGCVLTPEMSMTDPPYFSAKSSSAFTFTTAGAANMASGKIDYVCFN